MMREIPHHALPFGSWTEGIQDDDVVENFQKIKHVESQEKCNQESFVDETVALSEGDELLSARGDFRIGDHVFLRCKIIQQRHGIVVHVDSGNEAFLILDFSEQPIGADSASEVVCFRFCREQKAYTKWQKVEYGVTKLQRALKPPGTCTCDTADPSSIVLDRVNFLMTHYHLIPDQNVVSSNSGTLAFWCSTGEWRALQLNHLMDISNTASVVGTGSVATYATLEGAGLCCLFGAELAIAAPLLLPAIAIGSLAAGGATVWNSHQTRKEWKHITEQLNLEFDRFQKRRLGDQPKIEC